LKEKRNESFRAKEFFDSLNAIGCIPTSLVHWEMTGDNRMVREALE